MASRGAAALFVPTNNGLPPAKAATALVARSRSVDIARAVENSVYVIRADVAGSAGGLVSHGSSGIVDPDGTVLRAARQPGPEVIMADIKTVTRGRRRGWDAARNRAVADEYLRLLTGTRDSDHDVGPAAV